MTVAKMQAFSNIQAHVSLKVETRNTFQSNIFNAHGLYPPTACSQQIRHRGFQEPNSTISAVHAYSNEMPKTL